MASGSAQTNNLDSTQQTARTLPPSITKIIRSPNYANATWSLDEGIFKAQVLAGYIDAKSGKRLAYAIVINDIGPFKGFEDALAAFDAEGQIATVIYEDN